MKCAFLHPELVLLHTDGPSATLARRERSPVSLLGVLLEVRRPVVALGGLVSPEDFPYFLPFA